MAASQSLFRRHRSRGDVENDNIGGGGGGGRMDIENSNQGQDTITENSTTIDMPLSSNNVTGEGVSSSLTNNNTATSNDPVTTSISNVTSNIDIDEEEELIVSVPQNSNNYNNILGGGVQFTIPPVWEPSEEATAQRRRAIHQEVERIQRANFLHFMVLCLVPTTLLIIVIAAILSEDGECNGDVDGLTICQREPRSFVNAFTSRCICDAIQKVVINNGEDEVDTEENDEEGV